MDRILERRLGKGDTELKALRFGKFGPPSVLRIEDVPRPEPGSDEALVQVKNPVPTALVSWWTRRRLRLGKLF
jgi:hypothetical protein